MKSILANLGFVMQISGLLMIIPVIIAFLEKDATPIILLLITAITFLSGGFVLNALCERKMLKAKQSATLLVLVFISLSIIGAIPYFGLPSTNSPLVHFTNSVFESASGYTTTGFSVFNVSEMPRAIIFYRALTQFIGGLGIVLILIAFLYPEDKLEHFAATLGIGNQKIRRTFLLILLVYTIYALAIVGVSILLGQEDVLGLFSFAFATVSTGGFAPIADYTALLSNTAFGITILIGMILGASNFLAVAGLSKGNIKGLIKSEVPFYLLLIIIAIITGKFLLSFGGFDGALHIVSAMTNTGFQYIPLTGNILLATLTALMFIGGTSLSTAGGIKVFRFALMFKIIKKAIVESISEENYQIKLFGKEYSDRDIVYAVGIIFLVILTTVIGSLTLQGAGFGAIESTFEVVSALSNTGLSAGIVTAALAPGLKWGFIALMLLGRVEIISALIMLKKN